ncbi:MAG: hypothetical protein ACKO0M_09880 [Cyanobium sp.]
MGEGRQALQQARRAGGGQTRSRGVQWLWRQRLGTAGGLAPGHGRRQAPQRLQAIAPSGGTLNRPHLHP